MLSFGLDDYIVTPATPGELSQIFGQPSLRVAGGEHASGDDNGLAAAPPAKVSLLSGLPLADLLLDAILSHPQGGPAAAVRQINARLAPAIQLHYVAPGGEAPIPPDGAISLSHAVRVNSENAATLHLVLPRDEEESAARHFLAQLAGTIGKVATVEDRHVRLQKLATTDDLTGLYNARYFRHFLSRIIREAHAQRFPVTLMLFDLDGFKTYNDQFGHGVGDEILRQTAGIIRRCVRDHDVVARLGGDEFAVVLWEKEGPRLPREGPPQAIPSSRIPQTPTQIFQRIQRLISSPDFSILGATGKGQLTISAGMAVYPYDAQDVNGLIEVADRELMFGAKQAGKNCLKIVGRDAEGPGTNSAD
jgi:GGDEF domain-containing protein